MNTYTCNITHLFKKNKTKIKQKSYIRDGRTALVKCTKMITATCGLNATMEGEAVNYMSPSDRGDKHITREMNKLHRMFGQGLPYTLKSLQWHTVNTITNHLALQSLRLS
jgi:hypothetical protein